MVLPVDNAIQYIRLSDLANKIRKTISEAFGGLTFWVLAEVSGHKYYPNNDWHYFSLVEKIEHADVAVAKIKCKSWSGGSQSIRKFENATGQVFTDGIQVLVKVEVEYHIVHELSLTLLDIDIAYTLGTLEKQRQATLMKLVAENPEYIKLVDGVYVTRNKSLPLNRVIQNIAVIGSEKSKGLTDFLHTMQNNRFRYTFSIDYYYSSVQGNDAERQLVNALIAVHACKKPYDAVVILRGGGSRTDFLVFDTYKLARAVARFPIPIITGIGHHEDVSIVDLMAHSHKIVPTKAAEFIIAHNRKFEENILQLQNFIIINSQKGFSSRLHQLHQCNHAIIHHTRNILSGRMESLNSCYRIMAGTTGNMVFNHKHRLLSIANAVTAKPGMVLSGKKDALKNLGQMMETGVKKYFINKNTGLQHHSSVMKLMSPVNILKKGFAVIYHKGKIAGNAEGVSAGDDIMIRMLEAQIKTTVNSKVKTDGNTDL